jgi:ubiquinone/menaquinone biosynthesis C-methylase UbiE
MSNAETFGRQAATYAKGRPSYPPDLFDWIAAQVPEHSLALDVGTGSGQAAMALTEHFDHVIATDLSDAQIAAAPDHPQITYRATSANQSTLDNDTANVVTVATALHWFATPEFWIEVKRVTKSGGLFCAWTYHRADVDADMETHLLAPILDIIDPYWAEGNRLSWRGYDPVELALPFEPVVMPKFTCELAWTAEQFADHIESWSAHFRAREDGLSDALSDIRLRALNTLGPDVRQVRLPLNTLAARVP